MITFKHSYGHWQGFAGAQRFNDDTDPFFANIKVDDAEGTAILGCTYESGSEAKLSIEFIEGDDDDDEDPKFFGVWEYFMDTDNPLAAKEEAERILSVAVTSDNLEEIGFEWNQCG